ncbi:hypothetical protein EJB05_32180, partial [Eragrostis curvula]
MESHPKKRKAMEEEDRLSRLPDDLLHSILHGLQLKHAARTSALSRRWSRLWLRALAASSVIDFTDRDFARGQSAARAAATVSRCLQLHAENGAPLDVFRVALDVTLGCDGAFERDVVGWVAFALGRGRAREVEVDLTPAHRNRAQQLDADQDGATFMELPGDVFLTENSLARLSLDRFSLRAVTPGAPGLAGLRSLSLSRADVTDEAVQAVVSSCRLLEFLSLSSCHLLTSVRISGDNLQRLELVRCPAVQELRVAAPALESFVFHGDVVDLYDWESEEVVGVDMGATPVLRDAYLSHIGFGTADDVDIKEYAYFDFMSRVAHAPTLTLCSVGMRHIRAQLNYDDLMEIDMTNIEELQLLMASLDEDDLEALFSFLQLNPITILDRLFIRLPIDAAEASGVAAPPIHEAQGSFIADYVDNLVLDHLRLIKVVNFRGTRCELVMISFLLKKAPALEQLVLVAVEEERGASGDELLKIIQGKVSAMQKASPEVRVTVCRPSEDRSQNPAHTRFYHEE